MKVIDPGHEYDLTWLDGEPETYGDAEIWAAQEIKPENRLVFVKREGIGYPGNVGHHPGTNLQEVLRACIDRVKYLNHQIPDAYNENVIDNLQRTIWYLEKRAAQRHGRQLTQPGWKNIELQPTCTHCGHVGCEGACRGHESPVIEPSSE